MAGISTLWLVQPVLLSSASGNFSNMGLLAALATFGALVPDLDAGKSKIKYLRVGALQPFVPVSALFHRTLGHRGLLHSLLGWGIFAALTLPLALWWGWLPALALILGYGSHLATDAATKSGIPWLYPKRRRYHLMPKSLRLTTGSAAEDAVFALFAMCALLLLLRQLPFGYS